MEHATAFRRDPSGHWEFHDGNNVFSSLPSGYYSIEDHLEGIWLVPKTVSLDAIIPLPNPSAEKAKNLAYRFIDGVYDQSMSNMGLLKKMAMLLWGDPGTSKSVTVYEIVQLAVEKNWVALKCNGDINNLLKALSLLREAEPLRGILVVMEEFDSLFDYYETQLLELLDGANQIPNVFYLMTTNYIQRIPSRVFLRMRRIPFQVEFKFPGLDERLKYFQHKIPLEHLKNINLEEWVGRTEGFSLDQCAQVVLSVFAFNQPLEEVLEDLQIRKQLVEG